MPDLIQDKNVNDLLNSKTDLPTNKLLLEASLLGGGIKDGFLARKDQAAENLGLTALEFAGTAAIGYGLTMAQKAGGRWGAAAAIASRGFMYLALGDAARRLGPTAYAIGDTYVSPENYAENRASIAKNLGSACFDYPLMAAGGMLGAKAALSSHKAISSSFSKPIDLAPEFKFPPLPPTEALLKMGLEISAEQRAGMQALREAAKLPVSKPSVNIAAESQAGLHPSEFGKSLRTEGLAKAFQGSPKFENPWHDFRLDLKFDPASIKMPTLTETIVIRPTMTIIPLPLSDQLRKQGN